MPVVAAPDTATANTRFAFQGVQLQVLCLGLLIDGLPMHVTALDI